MGSSVNWEEIRGDDLNLSYCHHFLEPERATSLLKTLESELVYFSGDKAKIKIFGKWRDIPRQQVAFGDPGLTYTFSGLSVPALAWPKVLEDLRDEIYDRIGTYFNFVLVNRYRDGRDNIGEHRDDEKELNVNSGIASLSLGQARDFVLRHKDLKNKIRHVPPVKVILGHGSLLHMKHPTNSFWYHSLPPRKSLPGVRINLTFRSITRQKERPSLRKNSL
ncbi:DNA oxidative demethylase ALKBH2-like [Cimex lectularius]|uniref:DNA oxidative demethylase ALKBH2 n=1 Tax=Cimex lectularius TaxID=79782 RepID=A0A8I6RDN4_CIMLE|nr:DNA oxidative demethylase ALKBH2-like [Cimex lectularius]